jgi:signal transduction histidine kinase
VTLSKNPDDAVITFFDIHTLKTTAVRAEEYGEMKGSIEDRTRKLREVNAVLMREVAERKRLEQDLIERTGKLEEADRRKNEFLAVLSHELRNPLAPIIASVEAMKLRGTDDAEMKHTFDIIGRQAEQMTRLLKDLLDVSKILYDKIELSPEYVDIRKVVQHAVETTEFFITKRKHALTLDLPNDPKYLVVDPLRIEQILANLIFNAAKYTNPGGKIEINLSSEKYLGNEGLSIAVKDDGIGIPPEIMPQIFDLFVQADKVLQKTKGGMGIGLFLVQRLANLHGGIITAESKEGGGGSTFTLHLPIKNNLAAARGVPLTPANGKADIPKRILVTDDNQDAADSLGKLLSHLGHSVKIAYSGKEALRLVKEKPFDMAFIDIAMPEMDGYETVKKMREDPSISETKLIALTGFGQKEDKEKALHAGFGFHYVKPITLAILKEVIGGA